MRLLARIILGALFLGVLPLFLISQATRSTLLDSIFWKQTLKASGTYQEIATQISSMQESMRMPSDPPTEEEVQGVVESNVENIIDFAHGKTPSISLVLKPDELHVPTIFRQMPEFALLYQPINSNILIQQTIKDPKQKESVLQILSIIQFVGSKADMFWLVFLVSSIVFFLGFTSLGDSFRSKFQPSALLLFAGGLLSLLAAVATKQLLTNMISGMQNLPPWVVGITTPILQGFFLPGILGGSVVTVLGLSGFLGALAIPQKKPDMKGKSTSTSVSPKRKALGCIALGGGVLLVLLFLGIKSGAVKINLSATRNDTKSGTTTTNSKTSSAPSGKAELVDTPYNSGFGWSIRYPKGWEVIQSKAQKAAGFKKPFNPNDPKDKENLALLAIEPITKPAEVDTGEAAGIISDLIKTGKIASAPNSKIVEEPAEDMWNGFIRIQALLDYQYGPQKIPMRQLRWHLYPKSGGNGYFLYTQTYPGKFSVFRPILEEAMNTFILTK